MRRVVLGATVDAMGVDELVLAVAAHRQHMAPLVDELSRSPDTCLRRIARMLEVQGRHLDRLCAELDEKSTSADPSRYAPPRAAEGPRQPSLARVNQRAMFRT